MLKKFANGFEKSRVEVGRFGQRVAARDGREIRIAQRERNRSRVKRRIAQTLRRLLAQITERGFQQLAVVRIFAERLIVRKRFWLGIDEKFIGVNAARFAVERRAPLPKSFFQAFQRNSLQLRDRFDAQAFQGRFRHFPNARNAPHRQRRKKYRFASRRNPDQPARFGLIAGDFCDQARRAQSARARQAGRRSDFQQKFVRCGERRPVQPLRSGEVEICLVNRSHFHDRANISPGSRRRDRSIAP